MLHGSTSTKQGRGTCVHFNIVMEGTSVAAHPKEGEEVSKTKGFFVITLVLASTVKAWCV